MKRIIYFIIIAVISAPAFSAVKGGKFFNAEESLSEDKRVLSRINSGDEAFAEYEAQQVRFEAEIEKRKVLQSQKVNIMRDKNAESLDEDMQAETAKKAELEKRRAEIERKTRELEERKAIVREKKARLESKLEKSGGEASKNKEPKAREISDDELELKATESEERRMNPVLFKLIIPADSFSKKEYELTKDAKDEIKKCAAQIKKLSYRKITVEGHCDSFETQYEAKKSSRLRAKAVYDELIENGINPDKTQYVGLADKIREETNKTKKGRQANRRTEIFVE